VIVSFGDQMTEDVYNGKNTKAARRIPRELWDRVETKLDMLNAAVSLHDLRIPPSNHLELLRGGLRGWMSIRINQQYRLIFRFEKGNCLDVRCTDYH